MGTRLEEGQHPAHLNNPSKDPALQPPNNLRKKPRIPDTRIPDTVVNDAGRPNGPGSRSRLVEGLCVLTVLSLTTACATTVTNQEGAPVVVPSNNQETGQTSGHPPAEKLTPRPGPEAQEATSNESAPEAQGTIETPGTTETPETPGTTETTETPTPVTVPVTLSTWNGQQEQLEITVTPESPSPSPGVTVTPTGTPEAPGWQISVDQVSSARELMEKALEGLLKVIISDLLSDSSQGESLAVAMAWTVDDQGRPTALVVLTNPVTNESYGHYAIRSTGENTVTTQSLPPLPDNLGPESGVRIGLAQNEEGQPVIVAYQQDSEGREIITPTPTAPNAPNQPTTGKGKVLYEYQPGEPGQWQKTESKSEPSTSEPTTEQVNNWGNITLVLEPSMVNKGITGIQLNTEQFPDAQERLQSAVDLAIARALTLDLSNFSPFMSSGVKYSLDPTPVIVFQQEMNQRGLTGVEGALKLIREKRAQELPILYPMLTQPEGGGEIAPSIVDLGKPIIIVFTDEAGPVGYSLNTSFTYLRRADGGLTIKIYNTTLLEGGSLRANGLVALGLGWISYVKILAGGKDATQNRNPVTDYPEIINQLAPEINGKRIGVIKLLTN